MPGEANTGWAQASLLQGSECLRQARSAYNERPWLKGARKMGAGGRGKHGKRSTCAHHTWNMLIALGRAEGHTLAEKS